MIENLSETVILPIAGIIITFVLCYELINMLIARNTMHDIDTWMFFKYFFKMWVAVFIIIRTFDITMAVFDLAQNVISNSAGSISGDTAINIETHTAHHITHYHTGDHARCHSHISGSVKHKRKVM